MRQGRSSYGQLSAHQQSTDLDNRSNSSQISLYLGHCTLGDRLCSGVLGFVVCQYVRVELDGPFTNFS